MEQLAWSLASYADGLLDKRIKMQNVHESTEVICNIGQNLSVRFTAVRSNPPPYLNSIYKALETAGPNKPIELDTSLPTDRRRRYEWLMELKQGLQVTLVHVSYATGGNIGYLNWLWHSTATDIDNALQTTQPLIEELKKHIPQYHTRAMRRSMFEKFGLVMPTTKKSVLRVFYKDLVGDSSASANLSESEIDSRIAALIELEEPSLVYDLRDHFNGKQTKFDTLGKSQRISGRGHWYCR